MRFITPPQASTTAKTCRRFVLPDDEEYLALLFGALQELTIVGNWEQVSGITPEQAAAVFWQMFDDGHAQMEGCLIGQIITFAGSSSPGSLWLACDGSSYVRADYPELFAIIGTTYGSVDGSHFNLPDLRGRAGVGSGQASGLTNRPLGSSFGAEQHTLTVDEMPAHSHLYDRVTPFAAAFAGEPITAILTELPAATSSIGGNGAHNNMQPSLALAYWIRAKP